MKYFKMLGLAAIAALALTAFGASTASADVLCKAAPNKAGECPTASGSYASGTTFKATSTNATLAVSAFGINGVVCEDSAVSVKTTSAGSQTSGVAVTGEIPAGGLTWSGCKTEGFIVTSCTVSSNSSAYTGSIKATSDAGAGNLAVGATTTTVACPAVGMHCTYTSAANGVNLAVTGGNPAKFVATNQTLSATGEGCPATANWNATYTLTSPTALWVATKLD